MHDICRLTDYKVTRSKSDLAFFRRSEPGLTIALKLAHVSNSSNVPPDPVAILGQRQCDDKLTLCGAVSFCLCDASWNQRPPALKEGKAILTPSARQLGSCHFLQDTREEFWNVQNGNVWHAVLTLAAWSERETFPRCDCRELGLLQLFCDDKPTNKLDCSSQYSI